MIQRFTCVPAQEYEALVVTNGTVDQVEQSLDKISGQCQDFSKCTLIYFDTLNDLLVHLLQNESPAYHGKVLFMFFDGLNFVQKTLGDLIDHYNDRWHPRCVPYTYSMTLVVRAKTAKSAAPGAAAKTRGAAGGMERLDNAYFYLDRSVCDENACQDGLFLAIVAIAQDILKIGASHWPGEGPFHRRRAPWRRTHVPASQLSQELPVGRTGGAYQCGTGFL